MTNEEFETFLKEKIEKYFSIVRKNLELYPPQMKDYNWVEDFILYLELDDYELVLERQKGRRQ